MPFRMHINDFDMLLRTVHYSSNLQIATIHKNDKNIKCYLYYSSLVFEFSYKRY